MALLPIDAPVIECPWQKPDPPAAPAPKKSRKAAKTDPPVEPAPAPARAAAPPAEAAKTPEVEIVNNGSHVPVPLPFQPVSPMEILASSNPQLLGVMLRQIRDMQSVPPDTSNGALAVMGQLADGFKLGKDVSATSADVALHLTGRGERRELMSELADVLDDERLIEMFRSRSKFEDFLHACHRRSDLTISEGFAVQDYFNHELEKIYGRRHKRTTGEGLSGHEPADLVSKANLPANLHRKEIQNKFDAASPSEREILRKLGYKVQQGLLAARVTRTETTKTETVEVVQQKDDHPAGP
jgi:hypothetical protein